MLFLWRGHLFFFEDFFLEDFFFGTFPPSLRASDSPMAIACFLLVTFLPDLPLFSVPSLRSCIAFLTFFCAFFPYFAIVTPFLFHNWQTIVRRRVFGSSLYVYFNPTHGTEYPYLQTI